VVPVPHKKKSLKCRQPDIAKDRHIIRVFAAFSDILDQLVTVKNAILAQYNYVRVLFLRPPS
jgi:hypothetical protein